MRFDAGEGRIALCIAPFHPAMTRGTPTDRDLYDRQSLFAVFLGAPAGATVSTELLRNVFDLTPREAEICSALVSGQSPQQIAETTGRAEKTIRNQIQAVHDKVGVTSNRALGEAMSVFQTVGAMFNADPSGDGPVPGLAN
jgi:DNA-binding CsgD family transcriptional regulator